MVYKLYLDKDFFFLKSDQTISFTFIGQENHISKVSSNRTGKYNSIIFLEGKWKYLVNRIKD